MDIRCSSLQGQGREMGEELQWTWKGEEKLVSQSHKKDGGGRGGCFLVQAWATT